MPDHPEIPDLVAERGLLAVIASDLGVDDLGGVARAKALARFWPGPVALVLTRRPDRPVSPDAMDDRITLVAADSAIQKDLGAGQDRQTRRLAVRSLLEAARGQVPLERLYIVADRQLVELLPMFSFDDESPPVDLEILPSAGIPDGEALWPYADSLIVSDPGVAYPLAASQPSLPVRIVPRGWDDDAVGALSLIPGLGGPAQVSVIMPVRGGERIALRAVEAVLARTPELREIILIDDASPDRTLEMIGRTAHTDPRVRLLVNDRQQGFGATCNRGLALARGDVAAILGADTVVTPGWSTRLLELVASHPRIGAVAPYCNRAPRIQCYAGIGYDDQTLSGLEKFSARFARSNPREATPVTQISGICLVIPRRSLRLVGGFDPRYFPGGFEDEDWCVRLLAARLIPCRAENVFIHHEGAGSLAFETQSAEQIHEASWREFKKKWDLPLSWPLERGYDIEELRAGHYSRERHFIAPWSASEGVAR